MLNNTYEFILFLYAPLEQFEFTGYSALLLIFFYFGIFLSIENKLFFSKTTFGDYGTFFFLLKLNLVSIVKHLLKTNLVNKNQIYLPFFLFLFLLILINNFCGLLPYNGTLTASIMFVLTITTSIFFALTFLSIILFGSKALFFFYPSSAPKTLLKFLIVIELISYFVRLVSLPVRLIANLVSGHALLKILVGFIFLLGSSTTILKVLVFFPWFLILIIMLLETLVGFLQAYVFIFLLTIYLNQALTSMFH